MSFELYTPHLPKIEVVVYNRSDTLEIVKWLDGNHINFKYASNGFMSESLTIVFSTYVNLDTVPTVTEKLLHIGDVITYDPHTGFVTVIEAKDTPSWRQDWDRCSQ